ncbi:MAG: hypothetical protein AB7V04_06065 [Desulfomonilaceae bacterium]
MKDTRYVWNPLRLLSPKLDSEVEQLEEGPETEVYACETPERTVVKMLNQMIEMTKILQSGFKTECEDKICDCEELFHQVREQEKHCTTDLVKEYEILGENVFRAAIRLPSRLERIGVTLETLMICLKTKIKEGIPFSDKAHSELDEIFELTIDILKNLRDAFLTHNKFIMDHVKSQAVQLADFVEKARFAHWERLERGFCSPLASSLYIRILDSFNNIFDYVNKICLTIASLEAVPE